MENDLASASPARFGAFVVLLVSFLPAAVWVFVDAYLIGEAHWKLGRDGELQLGLFIVFCVTVCNVFAYLVTSPLYYVFHLGQRARLIAIHAVGGAILAYWSFIDGFPSRFLDVVGYRWIGSNSSGVAETIIATAVCAVVPFMVVMMVHVAVDRLCPNSDRAANKALM